MKCGALRFVICWRQPSTDRISSHGGRGVRRGMCLLLRVRSRSGRTSPALVCCLGSPHAGPHVLSALKCANPLRSDLALVSYLFMMKIVNVRQGAQQRYNDRISRGAIEIILTFVRSPLSQILQSMRARDLSLARGDNYARAIARTNIAL